MTKPNILFIDIETAPSLGFYFDPWKENNIVSNVKAWHLLSAAWKWAGEKKVHVKGLVDYPRYSKDKDDDSAITKELHALLNKADVVIAHNGDRFDLKKMNARFLKHGLTPPSPYKTVDTLKVVRRHFALESNRLNEVGKYLGVGQKLPHTGFKLWEDCINGDIAAWKLMKRYNQQDVVLLERVYELIKGWMPNHPNLAFFTREFGSCPNCGGRRIARGFNVNKRGRKQRFQCKQCGAWSESSVVERVE